MDHKQESNPEIPQQCTKKKAVKNNITSKTMILYQHQAKQSKTKQNKAKQSKAKQSKTKQNKAKQNKTMPQHNGNIIL